MLPKVLGSRTPSCIRTQSVIGFVCRQSHFLLAELVAHLGIGFISGAKLMTHSGPLGLADQVAELVVHSGFLF